MTLIPEVQSWLSDFEKAGLSKEQMDQLSTILGASDKAQNYVKESQLRQSDYNRQLDKARKDLDSKAADITSKEEQVADLERRLGEWKANADATITERSRKIEKLEAERTRIMSRLSSLKESYAIAEDDVKDLLETTPAPKADTSQSNPDLSRYLSKDDFSKEVSSYTRLYPLLSVELDDIRDEHRDLFGTGKRPDMKKIIQQALESGGKKSVRELWENEYKVADRKAELESQRAKEHDDLIRKEERTKVMSEISLPGQGGFKEPRTEGSPVFNLRKSAPAESKSEPAPVVQRRSMDTVMKAVQAHREGKYKSA